MRKLLTAALLFAAVAGTPTAASAHDDGWRGWDRNEWRDRDWDRRDWRDRDWRRDRWERKHWRQHRRWADRHRRWYYRYDRPYAYRGDMLCRTRWNHWGEPYRVCRRHW